MIDEYSVPQVCYPLLDVLLDRIIADTNWKSAAAMGPGPLFSHLVLCADSVLPPDNYNLQVSFHTVATTVILINFVKSNIIFNMLIHN